MCLATLMHGNRDASELAVSGISSCYATLNFSLWEGLGSWDVFNCWVDEEAKGHWWQDPIEGIQKYVLWKGKGTFELYHGIVCLGLPRTLCLTSYKSVGFPVCCVFSGGKWSSYVCLYSSQPKWVLIISAPSVSPCPTNTEARVWEVRGRWHLCNIHAAF